MKSWCLFVAVLGAAIVLVTQNVNAKDSSIVVSSAFTDTSQTDSFSRNGMAEAVSLTLNAKSSGSTVQYYDENGWHAMAVGDTVTAIKIRILSTSSTKQSAKYHYLDACGPIIVHRQMVIGVV